MAEVLVPEGSWTFDGEVLRIVPGSDRNVHDIRKLLGHQEIPLAALAGVVFEPAKRGGHLRLRLRRGADPLAEVVAGGLTPAADPYRLAVPRERTGAAEYFADEVRDMLSLSQTPAGPCEDFLLPGPAVPISASAGDGTVSFDGERVRLEWTIFAKQVKTAMGPQEFTVAELAGVEWHPLTGIGYGSLRFRLRGGPPAQAPEVDRHRLAWSVQRLGGTTSVVAAAGHARRP